MCVKSWYAEVIQLISDRRHENQLCWLEDLKEKLDWPHFYGW